MKLSNENFGHFARAVRLGIASGKIYDINEARKLVMDDMLHMFDASDSDAIYDSSFEFLFGKRGGTSMRSFFMTDELNDYRIESKTGKAWKIPIELKNEIITMLEKMGPKVYLTDDEDVRQILKGTPLIAYMAKNDVDFSISTLSGRDFEIMWDDDQKNIKYSTIPMMEIPKRFNGELPYFNIGDVIWYYDYFNETRFQASPIRRIGVVSSPVIGDMTDTLTIGWEVYPSTKERFRF